jgi:hypothetical protein
MNAGFAYHDALATLENDNYLEAETDFKELINTYPESNYALASLRKLFAMNPLLGDSSFDELNTYCDSISINPGDSLLGVSARWLSIHCDIRDQNYSQAVNSLDSVLANPQSLEDSIYALIDLGYVRTKQQDSANVKSMYVSTFSSLIPKSYRQFIGRRKEWIDELLNSKKYQEKPAPENRVTDSQNHPVQVMSVYPNPALNEITISFSLREKGNIGFLLVSLTGQVICEYGTKEYPSGVNSMVLDIARFSSGIYFLNVSVNGTNSATVKIVK